jgi:hypothetical protein
MVRGEVRERHLHMQERGQGHVSDTSHGGGGLQADEVVFADSFYAQCRFKARYWRS